MADGTLENITFVLGKFSITRAEHLWNNDMNSWITFEAKLGRTRGIPVELRDLTSQFLTAMQAAVSITLEKSVDPNL